MHSAVRRTARAEASPSGGPQLTLLWAPQASTRITSGHTSLLNESALYGRPDARKGQQLSTRSGVLRAARGQASGPRDSASRNYKAPFTTPFSEIRPRRASPAPLAVNATSSDELQPAAWGGGELRGSKSRKSSAHFWARQHPIHRPRFARFVLGIPPRAANASLSPRTAT